MFVALGVKLQKNLRSRHTGQERKVSQHGKGLLASRKALGQRKEAGGVRGSVTTAGQPEHLSLAGGGVFLKDHHPLTSVTHPDIAELVSLRASLV